MMEWTQRSAPGRPSGVAWHDAASVANAQVALLLRVLDEVDYGMVLVDGTGMLRYSNQLGLRELMHGPLRLAQGRVGAFAPDDQSAFTLALLDASRGRRCLFSAGDNGATVSVAVVPMTPGDEGPALALLLFGKRSAADTLSVDFFARAHGLTPAEVVVLKALCEGRKPKEIAREQGVAISTVRSHICSIRTKTQTASIRDLQKRVAVLPPITPVVKHAAACDFGARATPVTTH